MQTAATAAPLASLVPDSLVNKAFIRRSCSLRFEEASYPGMTPYHRRISKLVVDVAGRQETWYMVNFWSADPKAPAGMDNYLDLADATTAYLSWV
jgi:hypothetical protein